MSTSAELLSPRTDSCLEPQFQKLLAHVRSGNDGAATALFEQFERTVLVFVRRRLRADDPVRLEFDSTDLAQLTWTTVFEQLRQGEAFGRASDLRAFLRTIADNHYRRARRHCLAGKRTRAREEPLNQARHDRPAAGPDPAAHAEAADDWEQLLARLSENERRLLLAVGDGDSLAEAAEHFGVSARTVQRWAAHVRLMAG